MKITQSFEVARPVSAVWDLFQDIPVVVTCMPGAALTEDKGGGNFAGRVNIKLGPFNAAFDGEAQIAVDESARTGRIEGRGQDRKGGSRSKLVMDYAVGASPVGTRVQIDADVQLAGAIAQFGRTGVVTETANVLIAQFAKNVEATLRSPGSEPFAKGNAPLPKSSASSGAAYAAAPATNEISAFKIAWLLFASFFKRLIGLRA